MKMVDTAMNHAAVTFNGEFNREALNRESMVHFLTTIEEDWSKITKFAIKKYDEGDVVVLKFEDESLFIVLAPKESKAMTYFTAESPEEAADHALMLIGTNKSMRSLLLNLI